MTAERLMKSGLVLVFVLSLGGCMSARSPAFVEAASQDLSIPALDGGDDVVMAKDDEPSIFAPPDTTFERRQKLGNQFADRILNRSTRSTNKALEYKLQDIVDKLSEHIDGDRFIYKLYLLEDLRPNAFTTGGGHLFVTTGLIAALRSEGQVAAVIAHEMAHNASAHVIKGAHGRSIVRRTAAYSENVLHQRFGIPWLGNSLAFLVSTGVNKYTRQQEDEADAHGLDYIVAAGYDPHEAPRAVKALAMDRKNQSEIENFFFGRHSTARARIWQYSNLIKAKYAGLDVESRLRSTREFDRLASRYWVSKSAKIAAPAKP